MSDHTLKGNDSHIKTYIRTLILKKSPPSNQLFSMAITTLKQDLRFEDLSSYDEVLKQLSSRPKPMHLLLGNGFSMAYDSKIFSYNALYNFIESINDDFLSKLFSVIKTKNFELIMNQIDTFIEIAKISNVDDRIIKQLQDSNLKLQKSLIDAIGSLHPEHVFQMDEVKSKACFNFLSSYLNHEGFIFSTNYDLLLYWVLLRYSSDKAGDGFGRELENENEVNHGEDEIWSELIWGKNKSTQTIYYLHGALPFFDVGHQIEKEEYNSERYLLENIKERMKRKEYPIFVTSGSAKEKLDHIVHNKYLNYCYEKLSTITGSLVVFGFNFGEYDTHVISAINSAAKFSDGRKEKLFSVYIGVYSEGDLVHLKKVVGKFRCKVNVFAARTANVWG